jgi:hypothetical protein
LDLSQAVVLPEEDQALLDDSIDLHPPFTEPMVHSHDFAAECNPSSIALDRQFPGHPFPAAGDFACHCFQREFNR